MTQVTIKYSKYNPRHKTNYSKYNLRHILARIESRKHFTILYPLLYTTIYYILQFTIYYTIYTIYYILYIIYYTIYFYEVNSLCTRPYILTCVLHHISPTFTIFGTIFPYSSYPSRGFSTHSCILSPKNQPLFHTHFA